MNFSDLDFDKLQDIPPIQHYFDTPRVSVTEKGLVSMNAAFRKNVGTQREFRSQISPDGRYLVFYPMEPPNIHFSCNTSGTGQIPEKTRHAAACHLHNDLASGTTGMGRVL